MTYLAMFGTTELMVILIVVLILFGGSRIPRLLRGLGEGIREFRHAARSDETPSPSSLSGAQTTKGTKLAVNAPKEQKP